jgi:hypothetical protein
LCWYRSIPIPRTQHNPSVDYLFPTVCMRNFTLEANFGDDEAKPFVYDVETCPGLVLE